MSESFKAIDPENVVRQITFGQAEALVFQNRAAMAIAAANAIAAAMRRAAAMKSSFRMVFAAAGLGSCEFPVLLRSLRSAAACGPEAV